MVCLEAYEFFHKKTKRGSAARASLFYKIDPAGKDNFRFRCIAFCGDAYESL